LGHPAVSADALLEGAGVSSGLAERPMISPAAGEAPLKMRSLRCPDDEPERLRRTCC